MPINYGAAASLLAQGGAADQYERDRNYDLQLRELLDRRVGRQQTIAANLYSQEQGRRARMFELQQRAAMDERARELDSIESRIGEFGERRSAMVDAFTEGHYDEATRSEALKAIAERKRRLGAIDEFAKKHGYDTRSPDIMRRRAEIEEESTGAMEEVLMMGKVSTPPLQIVKPGPGGINFVHEYSVRSKGYEPRRPENPAEWFGDARNQLPDGRYVHWDGKTIIDNTGGMKPADIQKKRVEYITGGVPGELADRAIAAEQRMNAGDNSPETRDLATAPQVLMKKQEELAKIGEIDTLKHEMTGEKAQAAWDSRDIEEYNKAMNEMRAEGAKLAPQFRKKQTLESEISQLQSLLRGEPQQQPGVLSQPGEPPPNAQQPVETEQEPALEIQFDSSLSWPDYATNALHKLRSGDISSFAESPIPPIAPLSEGLDRHTADYAEARSMAIVAAVEAAALESVSRNNPAIRQLRNYAAQLELAAANARSR